MKNLHNGHVSSDGIKELKDMSLSELWELFPIILKEHNPDYALWYREEEDSLWPLLRGYGVCRINHIGSTAVKGLIAKPIIDILLELEDDYHADSVSELLQSKGWLEMAYDESEGTIDLNKGYTKLGFAEKVFHLHVKPQGDHGELYFRDYLRRHDDTARAYERLKLNLKEQFEYNRNGYTEAKTDFIRKYTQIARQEFEQCYG